MNMVRLCFVALMALAPSLALCQDATQSILPDRYALKVKKAPALQEGLFTYTVCLQLPEGDRVSSVFGTDLHPFELAAPGGVFNSPFNAGWSASGMNPNFFKLMPEIQDDSFATIGLRTGPESAASAGQRIPPWSKILARLGRVLHGRWCPAPAREHPHGWSLLCAADGGERRSGQRGGLLDAGDHAGEDSGR